MSAVSLNERRKYPRITDAIALCLDSEQSETLQPTPTHVVKMSCGGLHFLQEVNDKSHYVQVEFLDVDQSIHQLLAEHINYVLGKTGLTHRLAIPA